MCCACRPTDVPSVAMVGGGTWLAPSAQPCPARCMVPVPTAMWAVHCSLAINLRCSLRNPAIPHIASIFQIERSIESSVRSSPVARGAANPSLFSTSELDAETEIVHLVDCCDAALPPCLGVFPSSCRVRALCEWVLTRRWTAGARVE